MSKPSKNAFTGYTYQKHVTQLFLAKMDANGNWLWAREFGANSSGTYSLPAPIFTVWIGDDHGYDLETDYLGNIYITGWWSGDDAHFDAFTLNNPSWGPDTVTMAYVAKLDPTGNFIWVRKFDGVDDKRGERDNLLPFYDRLQHQFFKISR